MDLCASSLHHCIPRISSLNDLQPMYADDNCYIIGEIVPLSTVTNKRKSLLVHIHMKRNHKEKQ